MEQRKNFSADNISTEKEQTFEIVKYVPPSENTKFTYVDAARVLLLILSMSAGILYFGFWKGFFAGFCAAIIPFGILMAVKDKEKQIEAIGFLFGVFGVLNGEIISPGWAGLGIGFAIMLGAFIIWVNWKEILENKENNPMI